MMENQMKTIEEQLDARKKVTEVLKQYLHSVGEVRERLGYELNEGVRMYEARFGESFRPYFEQMREEDE